LKDKPVKQLSSLYCFRYLWWSAVVHQSRIIAEKAVVVWSISTIAPSIRFSYHSGVFFFDIFQPPEIVGKVIDWHRRPRDLTASIGTHSNRAVLSCGIHQVHQREIIRPKARIHDLCAFEIRGGLPLITGGRLDSAVG